jgi:catechol 2,3-dioxygenase-like lactoylglutathione lyase family enzyme
MKKSNRQPWMDAADFGRSLGPGIGFNLLVRDMPRMVEFATQVLGAQSPYSDEDFAVFIGHGAVWMAHADHSYLDNPLSGILQGAETRGAGVELRIYGRDPDAAETAARQRGFHVLAGALDKEHGLREAVILDDEGYAWVPSLPLSA